MQMPPLLAASAARLEPTAPVRLRVVEIGCVAARGLRQHASGMVKAVFERSFYLTLNRQWMCVGPRGLGAGALNAICEPWLLAGPLTRRVEVGAPVVWNGRTFHVGSLVISFADAEPWCPTPPKLCDQVTLGRGLSAFSATLPEPLPAEGLALLLLPARERKGLSPLAAAEAPAQHLGTLVRAAGGGRAQVDAKRLVSLLGLGPGLTPSGDDFLGGALIALHLIGLTALRDAIWDTLEPLVATMTNDISGAHLAAAAAGFGGAALHALLDDVITGGTAALPQRIAALAAIGHTSGWDALAGAVTILRASIR